MKAFVRIDEANQVVKQQERPIPTYGADEVLIKVEAFGVGIHDRYFIPAGADFPYVIGSEGSGVITRKGDEVKKFAVGDRVIFTTILQPQGGSWAEYAVTNEANLINLPANLSFAKGASVPVAGKTALECIRELNLTEDDTLFIAGASGAIGTLVIQLAAAIGIKVSASSSLQNHEYMESLGLAKAVDYKDPNWKNEIIEWSDGGVNAALAIQPGTGIATIEVVKDNGRLITVSGDSAQIVPVRGIAVQQMGHSHDTQKKVLELVDSITTGKIRVEIEKEYPFENALDAMAKTETRHARGKLIVKVPN